MKVALVHDWLTGLRGGEKCLEVLCRRFPDARLYTLLHRRNATSPLIERMAIRTSFLQRLPGIDRWYRHALPLMPYGIESFSLDRDLDLVVSLSHAVAKGVRVPDGVPHVSYCFTPMRYAWHLRRDYFGAAGPPQPWRLISLAAETARNSLLDRICRWDYEASSRVTRFVAISETVRRRIRDCYGRESRVICPPVDTSFYRPASVARDEFYLCVSALAPYKRIDLAVEACNRLRRRLVVIGSGPEYAKLARLAGPTVKLLGWRSDEEVRDYLQRCRALLFPGCEDFGIVPVEAQSCGTPVIAYGRGGATETVLPSDEQRVGSGRFFFRQSPERLVEAIRWLENHPEQFCSRMARRQAEQFAVERFERRLVSYLQHVVARWQTLGGRPGGSSDLARAA